MKKILVSRTRFFILFRSSILFGILLIFFSASLDLLAAPSAYRKNEQGNKLYQKEKYQEALKKYTEAQLSDPESLELHYNIGNVLYKQGRYDEAADEYAQSIFSDRDELKAYSFFNRGNTQFMQQDFQGAIESYIEALKLDPEDRDAKKNLELALQKLQESKTSSSEQPQDSSRGENQREQSPEQKEEKKSPEQETAQEPTLKPSPEEQEDQKKKQEEWQQRLLDAIEEQEREALKKSLRKDLKEEEKIEKDW